MAIVRMSMSFVTPRCTLSYNPKQREGSQDQVSTNPPLFRLPVSMVSVFGSRSIWQIRDSSHPIVGLKSTHRACTSLSAAIPLRNSFSELQFSSDGSRMALTAVTLPVIREGMKKLFAEGTIRRCSATVSRMGFRAPAGRRRVQASPPGLLESPVQIRQAMVA